MWANILEASLDGLTPRQRQLLPLPASVDTLGEYSEFQGEIIYTPPPFPPFCHKAFQGGGEGVCIF